MASAIFVLNGLVLVFKFPGHLILNHRKSRQGHLDWAEKPQIFLACVFLFERHLKEKVIDYRQKTPNFGCLLISDLSLGPKVFSGLKVKGPSWLLKKNC